MKGFRANGSSLPASERRPLLDGTDWAGIRRSHGSTRNTISANAIPNSIFLRAGARKASSMTRSYVRIVTCRYWYWERFYRCLVVCITTGNMWTDKRKEKFSIWENTLCKYCSLVFIYIKSQGVCLLSSLASAAYTHDIEHTTLRKENSTQCKSSIHLTLASDVNWTVVYDGLESERFLSLEMFYVDLSFPAHKAETQTAKGIELPETNISCCLEFAYTTVYIEVYLEKQLLWSQNIWFEEISKVAAFARNSTESFGDQLNSTLIIVRTGLDFAKASDNMGAFKIERCKWILAQSDFFQDFQTPQPLFF